MEDNKPPHFEHPQPQSNQPIFGQVDGNTPDIETLSNQVEVLDSKIDQKISQHIHNGGIATRINFNTDIIGLYETVSVAPTIVPTSPYDQIKIYVNGAVNRLYWYDAIGNTWNFIQIVPILPIGLAGTKVYYVSDSSGGTVNRKLTFQDGILTSEV